MTVRNRMAADGPRTRRLGDRQAVAPLVREPPAAERPRPAGVAVQSAVLGLDVRTVATRSLTDC